MLSRRTARWYPAGSTIDTDPFVLADGTLDTPFLAGMTGLAAATWSVSTSTTPGVGFLRFRQASRKPNLVSVPVFLAAGSYAAMSRRRAELVAALNPQRGAGRLRLSSDISTDDGADRWAEAVYVGGAEGDEGLGASGVTWYRTTLKFQLLGPWTTPELLRASWSGIAGAPYFPFSFPWSPSRSGVSEVEVLDVKGDAETWPAFDIFGPFTRVRVQSSTSDSAAFWEIQRATSASEMLRLSTRPGDEALTLWTSTDGITYVPSPTPNAWASLSGDSWFEPLTFRDQLDVQVDGTSAETRIELTADEGWQTAP